MQGYEHIDGIAAEAKMITEIACNVLQAAKELGLQLTNHQSTLVDMAATLMSLGIAKPVLKS